MSNRSHRRNEGDGTEAPSERAGHRGKDSGDRSGRAAQEDLACLLDELRTELLARGGTLRGVLASGSMAPLLRPGDEVLIRGYGAREPAPGDIALFESGGRKTVHRLIGTRVIEGRRWLVEKGDANRMASLLDPVDCLGRVIEIRRGEKRLELDSRTGRTLGALYLLLSWPAARTVVGKLPAASARYGRFEILCTRLFRVISRLVASLAWTLARRGPRGPVKARDSRSPS